MSKGVPFNLQFELAMLWRTLSILQSIDELSVISFYDKLIPNLKVMPKLSLSSYWSEIDMSRTNKSLVSTSLSYGSSEVKKDDLPLMNINELNYLKHDENIDEKHDPLQVIQKLYGTASTLIEKSSLLDRNTLLSVCLVMAVKSGRISLLLHFIMMVLNLNDPDLEIDINSIQDMCDFYSSMKTNHDVSIVHNNLEDNNIYTDPLMNLKNINNGNIDKLNEKYNMEHMVSNKSFTEKTTADGIHNHFRKQDRSNGILLSFGKADHGK